MSKEYVVITKKAVNIIKAAQIVVGATVVQLFDENDTLVFVAPLESIDQIFDKSLKVPMEG